MSSRASGNRFGWLSDEEDPRVEEVLREDNPALSRNAGPGANVPATSLGGVPATGPSTVPGPGRKRRRNRPKNPKALRNDPGRMMAGARIRRDVRRRVEQALADPEVVGEEGTNYSLLVESLLVRWLEDVGYSLEQR